MDRGSCRISIKCVVKILLLDVLHTIVHSVLLFIENCCFNRMIASHHHGFHTHFGIIKGSSIRSFHTLAHLFLVYSQVARC